MHTRTFSLPSHYDRPSTAFKDLKSECAIASLAIVHDDHIAAVSLPSRMHVVLPNVRCYLSQTVRVASSGSLQTMRQKQQ
jgi:hypothetical protein